MPALHRRAGPGSSVVRVRALQAVGVRAVQQLDVHARRSSQVRAHRRQQAGPVADPPGGVGRGARVAARALVGQHLCAASALAPSARSPCGAHLCLIRSGPVPAASALPSAAAPCARRLPRAGPVVHERTHLASWLPSPCGARAKARWAASRAP